METDDSQPYSPEELADPTIEVKISRDAVNQLPIHRYDGPIEIISDEQSLNRALEELKNEPLLGFDTESRPVFRRGENSMPSLLQLAGKDKVWLFQLQLLPDLAPLFSVLADPKRIKMGIAIRDDIRKLNELHSFNDGGFLELANVTQKAGIVNTGLRKLVALFLGFRISKGAQVSNWARTRLTPAQINYAATDAWVSRELYVKFEALGLISDASTAQAI